MPRILLATLAAALLAVPAAADGHSDLRLRGIVTAEDPVRSFVTVSSALQDHVLRVTPSSLVRIRVGMRVELRGTTLRRHGNGSRILARGVLLVRSEPREDNELDDDDEIEVRGTLISLSPLIVAVNGRTFTCDLPAGISLTGFRIGDFVEMTCDLVRGVFLLRELELEDEELDDERGEREDRSGPGGGGDHDSSGPGS